MTFRGALKVLVLALIPAIGCGGSGTGPSGGTSQFSKSGGDRQTGPSAGVLPQLLAVLVKNAAGQPVQGATVQWAVTAGGGVLSAPTSTTDGSGTASVSLTLGPGWGDNTVTATVAGVAQPVTFTETGGVAGGGNNVPERYGSDLWVANGYAYTGTWGHRGVAGNAVKVWQLSASGAPSLVDSIITPNISTVSDIQVSPDSQLLVFTTEGGLGTGIYVYSLSNPAHPNFLGRSLVTSSGGLHTVTLSIIGGKLWAFTANDPPSPSWFIYDLSNPAAPVLADSIPIPPNYGIHDTYVRNGIAFVCAWNTGVLIYDVGDGRQGGSPTNPQLISSLVTNQNGISGARAHNAWWFKNPVTGEMKYLFVGQEGPGTVGSSSSGDIHVLDVSNLSAPVEVASYHMNVPGSTAGSHNFWMDESKQILYAAYYNGGVVALDVSGTLSGSLASRELARIQPGGPGNTYVWSVQLYGGSLYAIDMVSGLWRLSVPQ